ncbi:MAG: hypothetical protein HQL30_10625, partial [Candidatus Omnitrophica bacterium]|nr:hypothetical protein [Candidatus Omnitrophota bacterium]
LEEVPPEEVFAKLKAINKYMRSRASGANVKPPVFVKPQKKIARVSSDVYTEKVEEIGENIETDDDTGTGETATVVLPDIVTKADRVARLGVGLDLGTAYIVASREVEDKKVFVKNERNAFLSVRSDNSTKELLSKLKIKYVAMGDQLYVLGAMALTLADIFGRETQRSMNMGILNPSESSSIPIIKLIVENILWPPRTKGEICCFSVPAQPIDRDQDTIYHKGVFEGILRAIGFDPMIIDEGYAVVLSEMESNDFTGIGVSCGGGMVNVCAAFKCMPVLSFSITRGGDWIDRSASSVLGVPSTRVTAIKEQGMNIKDPKTREEEAIAIYYRNYINYFLTSIAKVLGKSQDTPKFEKPVDIVFAGGSSMVGGFMDVVAEEIQGMNFGFQVGKLTKAEEPFTSVARGCLFNAITAEKKG